MLNRIARQGIVLSATILLGGAIAGSVSAQTIDSTNWGSVTAPVYGTSETIQGGVYSAAELFAGPNKFGSYYSGVLPNGKIVKPAGISAQIGQNPLGAVVTADGKYLITTNDDERNNGVSLQPNGLTAIGGYTITVVDTTTMKIVGQLASTQLFIGLQVVGSGPYTIYASGGGSNAIKTFTVSADGTTITPGTAITILPTQPANAGYVTNYKPSLPTGTQTPSGFSAGGIKTTFPAGSTLSPDGRYLYVACNGDNSVAVIDTTNNTVVKQVQVGYLPYGVALSGDGSKVYVSNWGITEYKFANAGYDASGNLTSLTRTGTLPDGFYVPVTDTSSTRKTSSISVLSATGANPNTLALLGSIYQGQPLDALKQVGDTHPSAMAVVRNAGAEVLYITKSNNDSIGLIQINNNRKLPDFNLSPLAITPADGHKVHGSYPNAIAVSPDNRRVYVAEAGLNSIAVLDTTLPTQPKLIGRIPTGWYPTGVTVSSDGNTLYVINAKGIGEDINPNTNIVATPGNPTGVESFNDGNYIFGSAQKIDLTTLTFDNSTALGYNYAFNPPADTSVVPVGGTAGSDRIKHVFFILHENKTFDSMLGNQTAFGAFASTTFNNRAGVAGTNPQYTGVALNMQTLANAFATGVNYYSDSEESDAGHQFSASGTSSDYTQKTLLVKTGRGLLANKNFEPEDYPEAGYIFNNAARNGVSFKDYGAMVRIEGTDTGTNTPTTLNDPSSGLAGYPKLATPTTITNPLVNVGNTGGGNHDATDTTVQTTGTSAGLGQSYYLKLPIVSILGANNDPATTGTDEPHLDKNYPGYNFNISDQRRAQEFISDFDRMVAANKLPKFLYIYQPNDHTGGAQAPNTSGTSSIGQTAAQQVADGDVGLGMVVSHIMNSPVYYDANTNTGSAIFITFDDAQATSDHIHQHRTPVIVVSPFAKAGYVATRHYVTASIVKTEELLMGLPPNNYGDLFATDLRDFFQPTYNGITLANLTFNRIAKYVPSTEGKKIWTLVAKLDTSAPDRDSRRLGALARLSQRADELHTAAAKHKTLTSKAYKAEQAKLLQLATKLVSAPAHRDSDD